jgi:hypothetical protein
MMILSEKGISFLFTSNPYEQKQLSDVRFTPNHFKSYLKIQEEAGRYGVSNKKYLSFGLNRETLIASLSQPNQNSEMVVYDQTSKTFSNDILSFLRLLSEKKNMDYVSMYKRKAEKAFLNNKLHSHAFLTSSNVSCAFFLAVSPAFCIFSNIYSSVILFLFSCNSVKYLSNELQRSILNSH